MGDRFVVQDGLAASQSAAARTTFDTGKAIATKYEEALARMKQLTAQIASEERVGSPSTDKLAALRAQLATASLDANAAKTKFVATVKPTETTVELTTPRTETVTIADTAVPIGGGAQGDVFVLGDSAIKIPTPTGSIENALRGARLGQRYGGLGSGEVVNVKIGDQIKQGVKMRKLNGEPLADVGPGSDVPFVTQQHIDAFRGYMVNAKTDGVILGDLNARNIMLGNDGRLTIIDNGAETFESFKAASRTATNNTISDQQIQADWSRQSDVFDWQIKRTLELLESKRDPTDLLAKQPDDTRMVGGALERLVLDNNRSDAVVFLDPVTNQEFIFDRDASLDLAKPGLGIRERGRVAASVLFGEQLGNARVVELDVKGERQRGVLRATDAPPPLVLDGQVLDFVGARVGDLWTFGPANPATPLPAVSPRSAAMLQRVLDLRSGLEPRLKRYLTDIQIVQTFDRIQELVRASAPNVGDLPPALRDLVIEGVARRGEYWGNNETLGTCVHVAHRNAISLRLNGFETYIVKIRGLNELGAKFKLFGIDPGGVIEKFLARFGYAVTQQGVDGHVVAAVKDADGTWRYLSWGTLHFDTKVMMESHYPNGVTEEWLPLDRYVQWEIESKAGTAPSAVNPKFADAVGYIATGGK